MISYLFHTCWTNQKDLDSVVVKTFFSGLETKTETLAIRSWDQDQYLGLQVWWSRPTPGQNELESREHGLKITSLAASVPTGDRALA